jgi:starch-binding outer membrane protein, SusD/RagB family
MSANNQIIGTHNREMTSMTNRLHRSRRARAAHVGLVLAAAQLLTACSGVLDVSLPGNVAASALDQPSLATTIVDGAQADFECAFSQYVETTATWSNEVLNSSGGAEVVGWSARFTRPEGGTGQCPTATSNRGSFNVYMPLQIARGQSEMAIEKLMGFTDAQVTGRSLLLARANLYSAFAHTLLSEGYCQVAVDDGPLLTPADGKAIAEARFTAAIAAATTANNNAVLNAARIGRARVRIALGNKAGAAADAKLVPANFVFNATFASTPVRRRNTVMEDINLKFHLAVAPAYRGLTFGGVADPRVIATNSNRVGIDAVTPHWSQGKYTQPESPMPLATWDEAQLIIAEAEGGQSAVDAINRIHTRYGLPAYAGGTEAQILTQIIEERRRSLWLDGHQINDKLRFNIPFATGVDQKGVRYNTETCIQLPLSEMTGRT